MAEDVLISDNFMKSKKTKRPGKAVKQIKDVEEIPLTPHSDTSTKTKARFDQLLRQAVDQGSVAELKPKRRKKKKVPDQDNVLEKLKKGEGLVKDEDAAILANTYVPGDSPKNEKSNNKRDKTLEGTENFAYEDETTFSTPSKKKGKKKKDTNITDRTPSISDLGPPAVSHHLDDSEKKVRKKKLPPLTHEVTGTSQKTPSTDVTLSEGKKVKKKKKPQPVADSEASPVISPDQSPRHVANNKKKITSETEGTADEISPREGKKKKKPTEDSHVVGFSEDAPTDAPQKVAKKKKKKVPAAEQPAEEELVVTPRSGFSATGDEAESVEMIDETTTNVKKRRKKKTESMETTSEGDVSRDVGDEGKILAVTIHRTDKLKNDFYILHPVVRVHVVDERTGLYLNKQHNDRNVTSYYENEQNSIRHIQPIITQPFDFKQRKSVLPMWEELLLFNENFNYFIQKDPKVIIFFELLDFVTMNTASRHYEEAKSQGGWHRIAWAFLKVVGSNEHLNVGSKVRLQLYHPPESYRLDPGPIELYQWWQTIVRRPYPSTLYVTLKGITPPSTVMPAMRSLYATQEEVGKMTYQDLKKSMGLTGKARGEGTQKKYLTTWNRLAGQACKVPNNLYHSLYAGRKGCFVLKFSHDGRSLACACHDQDGFPIFIYEIPSGELLGKLNGHFGIVYDLCWSKTDFLLLSSSSDGTARVWEMDELSSQSGEQLLPHPAFVYAAQFHPRVDRVVATGGYDQVIRVWQFNEDNTQPELLQEIEGHHGNVNSLCFDEDGTKLYSADSVGSIKIWNVYVSEEPSRRGFIRDWSLYQEIQEPELTGVPINYLKLHPSGRRLLVHCRDNILRMVDLRILRVMQKYIGALNFREEIHSTLSPCGTFVFAGSEDGSAYVWNTETGDQVACYSELNYRHPVTSVDYHPRDHMVAFCSLGDNQAVFLYKYNPQVAALDAGIPVKPKDNVDPAKTASKSGELSTTTLPSKEDFEASETARLEKVMKKLATVTLSSQPMIPAESHPLGQSPRMMRTTGLLGTASMGYDSSYLTPRSQSPPPPMFSPHAPHTLGSTMQQQQMSSQSLYYKQGEGSWRPGFSSVGRHGARPGSPTLWGKPPTMSMSASQGKAQFSFHPPVGKAAKLKKVVALYEYKGQRSDELSFLKGDVIKVLYKDNENWWMGELRDGQQGFFPANYVAEEEPSTDDGLDDATSREGGTEDEGGKKKTMAVKTKTGELRFLSATDDSEDDHRSPKRRPRRKKKLPESESQDSLEASTSKGRTVQDESYA